ncbi:acyloxyacyl hydrolase [Psychromonas sp.]|uniref:acyloxyacyl hydrolase n=1 Tax=Psychromonas sp. TaxID=1884585 RepID=UPI0039E4CDBF
MSKRDYGVLLGGGLGINYSFYEKVNLYFEGGPSWLSDVEYGKRGEALKDYGGHLMFFAKLGLQYSFLANWSVGYSFLHLSNGNRYEVNPAFNGNSVSIAYRF